jgi:uncharacterized protein (TIGR00251 family)
MKLQQAENGVLIGIRVKPSARRFAIRRTGDQLVIEVKSPPLDDKANEEAVRELSAFLGKPVRLLKGRRSRQKIFLVRDAALSEIESRLAGIDTRN